MMVRPGRATVRKGKGLPVPRQLAAEDIIQDSQPEDEVSDSNVQIVQGFARSRRRFPHGNPPPPLCTGCGKRVPLTTSQARKSPSRPRGSPGGRGTPCWQHQSHTRQGCTVCSPRCVTCSPHTRAGWGAGSADVGPGDPQPPAAVPRHDCHLPAAAQSRPAHNCVNAALDATLCRGALRRVGLNSRRCHQGCFQCRNRAGDVWHTLGALRNTIHRS